MVKVGDTVKVTNLHKDVKETDAVMRVLGKTGKAVRVANDSLMKFPVTVKFDVEGEFRLNIEEIEVIQTIKP
ncbi:MAG: hypothetical protein L0J35_00800 [Tetragenococcus halophilus]|nr:hypothetical protein [Tetragenococcus halophilus]